jgi:transposase-like protein
VSRAYRKPEPLATVSDVNLAHLAAQSEDGDPLDLLLREGAKLLLEAALQAEIDERLGRGRYEKRDAGQEGYRNGARTRRLTSGVGELEVAVPRVRDTAEPFVSQVLPQRVQITSGVRAFLPELYKGGLSMRDFAPALAEHLGSAGLSKSAVSRTCAQLKEDFAAWGQRSLADEEVVYLYIDGVYLAVRQKSREKEGVLVAHGVRADGSRVLLAVALGYRESTANWKDFLDELIRRGLRPPKLVICDGNPGMLRAIGEAWPETGLQRCIAHRMRNVLDKCPKAHWEAVKRGLRAIFYAADEAEARAMAAKFAERWEREFPAMTRCLVSALDSCLTFYRFPAEHWPRIRTSNLLERCFKEVRRRTNVVGRFPTEDSALTLVWAVIVGDTAKWRGVKMAGPTLRLIEQAAADLPRIFWAINALEEERLAA